MNRKISMLSGTALTVLALAPALAAHAQAANNSLGEVVVTATNTGATNLQKTPLSVDVIGSADSKKEGVESFRDLQMELEVAAPVLNTVQIPDGKTITYDIVHADDAALSVNLEVLAPAVVVQTGARLAGAAAASSRVGVFLRARGRLA